MADQTDRGTTCSTRLTCLLGYNTPKFVNIKSWKIGLLNRIVQVVIIGYIIGYGIVYQHGYQDSGPLVSVVTTKLKGADLLTVAHATDWMNNCPASTQPDMLLDYVDLVVPPQEPNSFFITTNMWMTCNQTLGVCPEKSSVKEAVCTKNSDCPQGKLLRGSNGITTGNCSKTETDKNGTCQVVAWCPVENENTTITYQGPNIDTRNFTVMVKNSISFPEMKPNFRVRNIPAETSHEILKTCKFDNTTAEGQSCPIFTLAQIVGMINESESFYDYLATQGAVVGLRIEWDCNLNYPPSSCRPKYSARRLDNPVSNASPGYNFRYPRYHYVDDVQYRDLVKAYGILFVIQVTGQGHLFSCTTLFIKLGSMLALLAIATIICDIIVLYIPLPESISNREIYRKEKYQDVNPPEKSCCNKYGTLNTNDNE